MHARLVANVLRRRKAQTEASHADHVVRDVTEACPSPAERFAECVRSCDAAPEEVAAAWEQYESLKERT